MPLKRVRYARRWPGARYTICCRTLKISCEDSMWCCRIASMMVDSSASVGVATSCATETMWCTRRSAKSTHTAWRRLLRDTTPHPDFSGRRVRCCGSSSTSPSAGKAWCAMSPRRAISAQTTAFAGSTPDCARMGPQCSWRHSIWSRVSRRESVRMACSGCSWIASGSSSAMGASYSGGGSAASPRHARMPRQCISFMSKQRSSGGALQSHSQSQRCHSAVLVGASHAPRRM